MAKKKKGVIITSICSLLVGAAVIAEVVIGGDTDSKESYASVAEVPEYEGEPYVILDGNEPSFTEEEMTTTAYEEYSPLDRYGRCGTAEACVGEELMPDEKRGDISSVKPTGWQSARYENVEGGSLYNRCHLIAYQLSGENANEENLITGTRYMNTEGMLPFENLVAEYVHETDHHVMYRVTPVFENDNLVASGVQMEAESVEDNGKGVKFNVYVYNIQPDIVIDYETGDNRAEETEKKDRTESADSDEKEAKKEYVLNTNTHKFHKPDCAGVKDMKAKNRKTYKGKRSELLEEGYSPCKSCNP